MGGRLATSGVNADGAVTDGLSAAFEQWIYNSGAGAVTLTAPTGLSYVGGVSTISITTGKWLCVLNVNGNYVHYRIF